MVVPRNATSSVLRPMRTVEDLAALPQSLNGRFPVKFYALSVQSSLSSLPTSSSALARDRHKQVAPRLHHGASSTGFAKSFPSRCHFVRAIDFVLNDKRTREKDAAIASKSTLDG
jgi:hypothetical protein